MKIIVQKFGGTSVKDDKGRKLALEHIKEAISEGYKVVVVVSAMGRKGDPYATDSLLGLLYGDQSAISPREQDLLLSCGETISSVVFTSMLLDNGVKAAALTGAQAGFLTNDQHTNAKIIEMRPERLFGVLANHDAVVVAGFQGATEKGDTTTIGRGGSDTSAAALGAAVDAEYIDIFTDVEGVMTADPSGGKCETASCRDIYRNLQPGVSRGEGHSSAGCGNCDAGQGSDPRPFDLFER